MDRSIFSFVTWKYLDTYLPIYLHLSQTRSDIFSYIIPPLVAINAQVAMKIGRRKISFEGWILIAIG